MWVGVCVCVNTTIYSKGASKDQLNTRNVNAKNVANYIFLYIL